MFLNLDVVFLRFFSSWWFLECLGNDFCAVTINKTLESFSKHWFSRPITLWFIDPITDRNQTRCCEVSNLYQPGALSTCPTCMLSLSMEVTVCGLCFYKCVGVSSYRLYRGLLWLGAHFCQQAKKEIKVEKLKRKNVTTWNKQYFL